jgi:hypothetical protein
MRERKPGLNRITLRIRYRNPKRPVSPKSMAYSTLKLPFVSGGIHSRNPTKDGTYKFSFDVARYRDAKGTINRTRVSSYLAKLFADRPDIEIMSVMADPAFGRHALIF